MGELDITIEGEGGRASRISFGPLSSLSSEVDGARTVVVTDPEIRRLHGAKLPPCPVALVPRGEEAKSLAELEALYGRFLELGLGRDGTVLALGGGTVSDLAGFAASTWMRGVDFGFAPTTLLSMVDASVGGKNGVDFRGVKNLIGSFSQPRFVRIDVSTLDTLSDAEFASGMGEVVKHAVIAGGGYFELVSSCAPYNGALGDAERTRSEALGDRVAQRAFARPDRETIERIVAGSVRIKAEVVQADERESGRRRLLNLGHTAGHGIELATGIPHGHAVAAGLVTACRLALRRGTLAVAELERITRLSAAWGLPTSIAEAVALVRVADSRELRAAISAAVVSDKKRQGGDILMALPRALGDVAIVPVPVAELQSFIMEAP